jgi:hypothetical protein
MSLPVNLNRPFDPRLFLTDQELDRSAGLLISGASVLAKAAESARKKAGLSKPELQILMAARYRPGLTVSEMRGTLGMTVPTFARIIGKLDERGLIERARETGDARRRDPDHAHRHRGARTPAPRLPGQRAGSGGRGPLPSRSAGEVARDERTRPYPDR